MGIESVQLCGPIECGAPLLVAGYRIARTHALTHSSLQVNPEDLSNDADPQFLAEFYKNLKILSQDLYKRSGTIKLPISQILYRSDNNDLLQSYISLLFCI